MSSAQFGMKGETSWGTNWSFWTGNCPSLVKKIPDEIDGILISDSKLREKFEEPVIEPMVSGGLHLSAPEKKALLVTPGTTTYEPISMDKMAVATEAAVAVSYLR